MNILLIIVAALSSVFISYKLVKSSFQGSLGFKKEGISKLLPGGGNKGESKAKILDNKPMQGAGLSTQTGTETDVIPFRQPRLPDMSGADNENKSRFPSIMPNRNNAGMGGTPSGGVGVNVLIGANLIGASLQSCKIIVNTSRGPHITGAVFQGGGMIYNLKSKGGKNVSQMASMIGNEFRRGRATINQAGRANNQIVGNKKAMIAQTGSNANVIGNNKRVRMYYNGNTENNFSGGVKRFKSNNGNFRTSNLKINGISRAQSMYVKNFMAPKGTIARLQKASNENYYQPNMLYEPKSGERRIMGVRSGSNVIVNYNDVNLQNIDAYALKKDTYLMNRNDSTVMLGLKKVFMDPKNANLNFDQKMRLYNLNNVKNKESAVALSSGNYFENDGQIDNEMLNRAVVEINNNTQLSNKEIRTLDERIAKVANQMGVQSNINKRIAAAQRANQRMDLYKANKSSLDGLLNDKGKTAGSNLRTYVGENFMKEGKRHLTESEMKEIEKKATEIIEKRKDIPLEEKEREKALNEVKEELTNEKQMDNMSEIVKEQVLGNMDVATEVLGEENAKELEKMMKENKSKQSKILAKEIISQEIKEDEDFVKEHPEYKELSSNEIHIKKKEEQARQYVAAAAMQIYAENEKRNKGVAQNNNNNQTYIYMPRQMQG